MMSSSWENPSWFNFDSFAASMMSLFQVTCFKFVHILWACMDATQEDFAPEEGASSEASIFFVVYILLGSVFTMNLFIGFVVGPVRIGMIVAHSNRHSFSLSP